MVASHWRGAQIEAEGALNIHWLGQFLTPQRRSAKWLSEGPQPRAGAQNGAH